MLGLGSPAAALGFLRGRWLRGNATTLGRYGVIQVVTQVVNALTGIVTVRLLPVDDFAMYTLALSVITAVSMATDSGVVNGLAAIGGKLYADSEQLGSLVASAAKVRRRLESFALVGGAGLLLWRLAHTGAHLAAIVAITVVSATIVHARISIDVYDQVLRLQLRSEESLRLEATSAIIRLVLGGGMAILYRSVVPVLAASVITTQIQRHRLRKRAYEHLSRAALPATRFIRGLWSSYATQAASSFYMMVNAQATVLILSFFGGNTAVAGIGALARYGALFALLNGLLTSFAYPRISRARTGEELKHRITLLLAGVTLVTVAITLIVCAEPRLVLWVLGARYQNLRPEVKLFFAASSFSMVVGVVWCIDAARGWLRGNWLTIPTAIAAQCIAAACVDVGTIRGAIVIAAAAAVPQAVVNLTLMIRGLRGKGIFEDIEAPEHGPA
jgi:O-antigen/teichoic acid export membrane protein